MPLVTRQATSGFFFRQSAEPVTANTGDVWVDTDNGVMSTFDGTNWVEQTGGAQGSARENLSMNTSGNALAYTDSMQSLLTNQGDVLQASSANTAARLAIGTANQVLSVNSGATAVEYADVSTLWSVLGDYEATSAEASHNFNFTAVDFDDDSKLVLAIDGNATATFDLLGRINTIATSNYFTDALTVIAGSQVLIDTNTATAFTIIPTSLIISSQFNFSAIVEIQLSKSSVDQNEPLCNTRSQGDAGVFYGRGRKTGVDETSITDIEVRTSTSTWVIGTRITLYLVARA